MPGWLLPTPLAGNSLLDEADSHQESHKQAENSTSKWPLNGAKVRIKDGKDLSHIPAFLSCFHHLPAAGFLIPGGKEKPAGMSKIGFLGSGNTPGAGRLPFGANIFHKKHHEGEEFLNGSRGRSD